MIKVGITGGIGSGKSLVCEVFARLNIPVYHADLEARKLTDSDPSIRNELTSLLGKTIYSGPTLNRVLMADLVFNDPNLLEKVNAIIHPRVAQHFMLWCNNSMFHPYVIQESAILFESKAYLGFDAVISVSCPEETRIQRVLIRKNMNREKILAVMKNQLPESEIIRRSDYVIDNDGTKLLLPQILRIHNILQHKVI
jgi:dephospho-CoA kinase